MRVPIRNIALLATALIVSAAMGCRAGIEVRTIASPDAGLSALHTFRMLPGPARRDGRQVAGDDDPMISNSIANRVIRERIAKAFQERGYTIDERNADFGVAFYATTKEKSDITVWDYGYPFYPPWPRYPYPYPRRATTVSRYTEGSVVVDVVRLAPRELLWRGEGTAELSDRVADNVEQLAKTAAAIVAKFPQGTPRVVATRH